MGYFGGFHEVLNDFLGFVIHFLRDFAAFLRILSILSEFLGVFHFNLLVGILSLSLPPAKYPKNLPLPLHEKKQKNKEWAGNLIEFQQVPPHLLWLLNSSFLSSFGRLLSSFFLVSVDLINLDANDANDANDADDANDGNSSLLGRSINFHWIPIEMNESSN